jgi:uncharacterized protein GlcG (DUF336 family)
MSDWRKRPLRVETLENRRLLASWHNDLLPADVNGDSSVTPLDALVVLTSLGQAQTSSIAVADAAPQFAPFLDVDDDGVVTPLDALGVLTYLKTTPVGDMIAAEGMMQPLQSPTPPADLSPFPAVFDERDLTANGLMISADSQMTAAEVETLLERASAATPSRDAIIAVVDRAGRILGVRVEADVAAELQGNADKLAFAIDGAVAKARTAAFFSSNAAPLTSRTVRFISQSTVTQREVESSPIHTDARFRGPGFVAPIGVGGQFPPEIPFTPQVDLLGIERQSRDSRVHAGADGVLQTADDFTLAKRFNAVEDAIPGNAKAFMGLWPESYGVVTATSLTSQSRGIATLPGGVPLYKTFTLNGAGRVNLVGGIGVFFPGEDGFATHEQGFVHASQRGGVPQSERERTNANKVLEAEFMAVAASVGGGIVARPEFIRNVADLNAKLPPLPNFVAINGRIDLVGITLEGIGPTPSPQFPVPGIDRLLAFGRSLIAANPVSSGVDVKVNGGGDLHLAGMPVPHGWLVAPQDSAIPGGLTAQDVKQMIDAGVAQANATRAAIRLKADFRPGATTRMVLAVADTHGNVLGLYRMPDATVFSIDVAVAKARNTAYYADADALMDADRVDFNGDGNFGPVSTAFGQTGDTLLPGTALTNRTFRFLAGPRFPTGVELPQSTVPLQSATLLCDQQPTLCHLVGPFSGLRLPGINPYTAENVINNNPLAFEIYADPNHSSPMFYDAFVRSRNFRDQGDHEVTLQGLNVSQPLANQNGIVFFPGSTPVYVSAGGGKVLGGGLGISGDGVDQDDVVTVASQRGFEPPTADRVDQFIVGDVRLPFQKFNRNPLV